MLCVHLYVHRSDSFIQKIHRRPSPCNTPPFPLLLLFVFFTYSYLEDEYHARKNGDKKDRDKILKDEKSAAKESSEGTESTEESQRDVNVDTEGSSEEKEGCTEHSLTLNLPVPPSPVIAAGGAGTEEGKDKDKDKDKDDDKGKKKKIGALTSIKASSISMPHFKCNVRQLYCIRSQSIVLCG